MTEPQFEAPKAACRRRTHPRPTIRRPASTHRLVPTRRPIPVPGDTDPAAPFGRHPITGEPLSDKSKVVAGLLQLLGLFGIVGVGRIYLGYTNLGIGQLSSASSHAVSAHSSGASSTPS